MKLIFFVLQIKESDSDLGMSHFLPVIKTIIPICLEDCSLAFATDRAGNKDLERFIYGGSVGHAYLSRCQKLNHRPGYTEAA